MHNKPDGDGPPKNAPSGGSEQMKKLSKGEIKKLKEAGYDIYEIKGGKNASKQDLFKDKDGNIHIKPKDGSGPGDPTGININDP